MADFPYQLDGELIVIPVMLLGKETSYSASFVLDTGASQIIIDHELALALDLGYSAREGVGLSTISSVVGRESGYRLIIESIEALGKKKCLIEVHCHDLRNQGIDGLLGMSFLKHFGWCVDPKRQMISVE